MAKYMPELEKYKEIMYHLTLTTPNVNGSELKQEIKDLAKCFQKLNRILSGHIKIKGLKFDNWGYQGAVRSLEATYKLDDYHPHYHCILVLKDLKMTSKDKINDYSYHYGNLKTYFSEEEILIQKIWYLLTNGHKVTKQNIEKTTLGYSCKMDKLGTDDFNELFKYMTKSTDEEGNILTYDQFKILHDALYRVKQIQGYGCLYRITDDGDLDMMEQEYQNLVDQLQKIENPEFALQSPQDLILDNVYTLISRKSYMKYLKSL
jgi:hypothetical protein